jgi:hypothetical protein
MNPLAWLFDVHVSSKGVSIMIFFNLIRVAHIPVEKIKSVRLMTTSEIFTEDIINFRIFAVRLGNRISKKALVVESRNMFLFKWFYLTPKDVFKCYEILLSELQKYQQDHPTEKVV